MEELVRNLDTTVRVNTGIIGEHKILIDNLRRDSDRMDRELSDIRATVHRIEVSQVSTAAKIVCPSPGLCLDLKEQLASLGKKVEAIADIQNKMLQKEAEHSGVNKRVETLEQMADDYKSTKATYRGVGKGAMAVLSILAGLAGGGITLLAELIAKGKIP